MTAIGTLALSERDQNKINFAIQQLLERENARTSTNTSITEPQGRATLQTAVPVMSTTQSAKTTLFYTPYVGNQVPIYDGSTITSTTFTELSVLTTDTTKSPAAIGASKVNDWFVWSDSGTIRIGHGPDWTSDTARSAGTALTMVNGVLLNSVAITNGPGASRGTYVCTTRSNASSQLDWIYGAVAANGTAGFFGVWNTYNRRPVSSFVGDNTNSWTYVSAAWRAANASATMRHSFVVGLVEDGFIAEYNAVASSDGVTRSLVGIGVNVTNAFTGATSFNAQTFAAPILAACKTTPALGLNFVSAIEYSDSGTATYQGDNGLVTLQSGLSINMMM